MKMQVKEKKSRRLKHGLWKSREWESWSHMLQRCRNPKNNRYLDYGGRGIDIDPRWLHFQNFFDDMGFRPEGTSLDRIDNEKGYSKENCRWADAVTQANNRRKRRVRMAA